MVTTSAFDTTLNNLGITRTSSSATVQKSASTTLGQADFLKLMTAQMQNQDPFNPTDNTQMVAQMAQFSSLAGINDTNPVLAEISKQIAAQTELLKDIKAGGITPTPTPATTPTEG